MPLSNPNKQKEYVRLSMAIKKARSEGKDVSELLSLRQQLTKKESLNESLNETKPESIKVSKSKSLNETLFKPEKFQLVSMGLIDNLYNEIKKITELIPQIPTAKRSCFSCIELKEEMKNLIGKWI